jgi:prolyl-tRNA synthetase
MRGREFLMKDAYSFDLDKEGARDSYNKMFVSYLKTYERLGLKAIPMSADTGPIGGDMSHEFLILAETGESEIACHNEFLNNNWLDGVDAESNLEKVVHTFTEKYAATDEMRDDKVEKSLGIDLVTARGIEVGHIFYFGDKYSSKLGAVVTGPNGEEVSVEMGSYGIGVSRLVGAIIEASHDDNGIIWPESVTPYMVGLINLRYGDDACTNACDDIYSSLNEAGVEVLYDDRDKKAGVKFANMDLIGLPWQIIIGPKGVKDGIVEFKNRKTGESVVLSPADALNRLKG